MPILILFLLTFCMQANAATDAARLETIRQETAVLETVPFEGVQRDCRQVGGITFGAKAKWANCHVTRGRWVATIDF